MFRMCSTAAASLTPRRSASSTAWINRSHPLPSTGGAYNEYDIASNSGRYYGYDLPVTYYSTPALISNGDDGVLFSWEEYNGTSVVPHLTTVSSAGVTDSSGPLIPGQEGGGGPVAPLLQREDGTFVGIIFVGDRQAPFFTLTPYMVAFDATGNALWSVANEQPLIATEDNGVIGTSGITYDQNGNATGRGAVKAQFTFDQNGNLTGKSIVTQSWLGNAYQVGSIDQFLVSPVYLATSWTAFQYGNQAGNGTATQNPQFPWLKSCTDKNGICQGPLGPRDLLWNAKQDLASQLTNSKDCSDAATNYVFSKFTSGDAKGRPVTAKSFVGYIQDRTTFYDGSIAKVQSKYALCGENYFRLNCNGDGLTIEQEFADTNSGKTAMTVTPSSPFKSFWQPNYTLPGPNDNGFGVGIDRSNSGVNIYNESVLFHEALHGLTAIYDPDLGSVLGAGSGGSVNVSLYTKNNVLSKCPSFKQ
jgi:hypothetical protein